jgi:hypothetical protein
MQDFIMWFVIGLTHITDVNGFDHIVFLMVLCAPYTWAQKWPLFWLVSFFTIGHSLSLAAAVLGWFKPNIEWVEFLIPLTILLTACANFILQFKKKTISNQVNSLFTLFFGCVHGLGFSFLLRSLVGQGNNLAFPLFSFNVGLEVGQILILLVLLLITTGILKLFPNKDHIRMQIFSGLGAILSLWLLIERFQAIQSF